jgi:hypothetical protein
MDIMGEKAAAEPASARTANERPSMVVVVELKNSQQTCEYAP